MANRPRTASTRNEEDMMAVARRKIQQTTDPVEKLRLLCLSRGAAGIMGMGKVFRRMDDDGSHNLNMEEFSKGIRETGLKLGEEDTEKLFKAFDKDGGGSVNYDEFLVAIRPKINERRKKLVDMAFDKLDKTDDGIVTLEDLKGVYSVQRHPKYQSGEMTEDQILGTVIKKFENNTSEDGKLTKDEFYDYYSGISASIDQDAYFDLMMRNAWGIK
ncbi:crustacean calcium-binding protein 23-like isoform X2 [Homarus americanus]|uniref:Calcyphosin-like protein-like n=2 Tax=Homarus americanus TaxID=6706 RepID=A0A8J5MQU5_HOMAM|nr:crustacean calcium-binding protein 23-like isoform X2 [Homarus americanus]XP_042237155.1 crustacean calcium-binding protein 23-like isoform X2 [Homarus americanus]KAG7160384.1 Calcyphosin-like protein-like [Homarus americanus]